MIFLGRLIKKDKVSFQSLTAVVGASVLISDIYAAAALHYVFTEQLVFSAGSAGDFCLFVFIIPLVYRKWEFQKAKDLVVAIIIVKIFGALLTATIFSAKVSLSYAGGPVSAESLQNIFGSLLNFMSTRVILASLLCVIVDAYLILYLYNILMLKVPEKTTDSTLLNNTKEFLIFTVAAYLTLIVDSLIFVTGAFFGTPFYFNLLLTHFIIKLFISCLFGLMIVLGLKIIPTEELEQTFDKLNQE